MVNQDRYKFQQKVLKYLEANGWYCLVQSKDAFPEILAWRLLTDRNKKPIPFILMNEKDNTKKVITPFIIAGIKCKTNKYLDKEEKNKVLELFKSSFFNLFAVAYIKNEELLFYEMSHTIQNIPQINEKSYIG